MTRIRKAPPGSKAIETPEATIKRLTAERDQFREWWCDATGERDRARKRATELEASLRSITVLSRVALGELVERAEYDADIPF